ncbi:PAS domain S-box protein [bacterium]|nr:PAS domain S-box protein [bacterium]
MSTNNEIEKLRESEERYRTMIEMACDAIFVVDAESGSVCEVNQSGLIMTGLAIEEIVGRPVWELFPEDERDRGRELFDTAVREERGRRTSMHFVRPDGGRVTLDVTTALMRLSGRKIVVQVCRDATERDEFERQQARLSQYYERLLDSLPVGLGIRAAINATPKIEFENQTLKRMFDTAACKGSGITWDACRADMDEQPRIAITDDGSYAEERRLANGQTFLYTISYVRDLLDQWCEVTIVQDFTRRRQLEDDLEQVNRTLEARVQERTRELEEKQTQLAQAEKMASLGSLVAGVAHEINTPLGALTSNNDLFIRAIVRLKKLLDTSEVTSDAAMKERFDRILDSIDEVTSVNKTAGERIKNIVNSLRSFARLDRSEKDRVDIRDGLESTLTLVSHELKNRVEVVRRYGDIPPINCFPNQINQVFMNLLVNASHAIKDKGVITIRTALEGGWVVVEISDTGSGIPKDVLPKIFDPGFTTKGSGVGTGLGLSIVHQIIQDHGGKILVTSKPGEGTTFRIELPAR